MWLIKWEKVTYKWWTSVISIFKAGLDGAIRAKIIQQLETVLTDPRIIKNFNGYLTKNLYLSQKSLKVLLELMLLKSEEKLWDNFMTPWQNTLHCPMSTVETADRQKYSTVRSTFTKMEVALNVIQKIKFNVCKLSFT